jgi:hypothetical protein
LWIVDVDSSGPNEDAFIIVLCLGVISLKVVFISLTIGSAMIVVPDEEEDDEEEAGVVEECC